MAGDVSPYTDLITSEHADKPNFVALASALVQPFADMLETKDTSFSGSQIPIVEYGDNVVVLADVDNNLLTPQNVSRISGIYRNDWQGRQLLYDTPRTNYCIYSNVFDSHWGTNGCTVTKSATLVGPDGVSPVYIMQASVGVTYIALSGPASYSVSGGDSVVHFLDVAPGTNNFATVQIATSPPVGYAGAYAEFDLTNPSIPTRIYSYFGSGATTADKPTNVTAWGINLPNGFVRLYIACTIPSGTSQANPYISFDNTGNGWSGSSTGNETIILANYQTEIASAPGVLIPTDGTAVTVTDYTPNSGVEFTLGQTVDAASGEFIDWDGDYTNVVPIGPLASMPTLFDVDAAVGDQLDKVGEWIGISRDLDVALQNVYFSLDVSGLGLDEGSWWRTTDPTSGLVYLPDGAYRTLLRAKIATNKWDGSIEEAISIWNSLFAEKGVTLLMQDYADMSMLFGFLSLSGLDAVTRALLSSGKLDLRPEGVRIRGYVVPSAANTPFFGLDADSAEVAGLDTGALATAI